MNFLEGFLEALESLRGNKMRSALTMFGIIIGVASVITVVAIGQGGRASIMGEFDKGGANVLEFYYQDEQVGTPNQRDALTKEDALQIKKQISGLVEVDPEITGTAEVVKKTIKKNLMVTAGLENSKKMNNIEIVSGRFYNDSEERAKMRVAVVEEKLIKELFPNGSGLDQKIFINGTPYKIIGITKSISSSLNLGISSYTAYLPLSSWCAMSGNPNVLSWIKVKMAEGGNEKEIGDKILALLHFRHHNTDKYHVFSSDQIKEQINSVTGILTIIVGSIAGISLLVGGIGVMNIMLVSVTERTREIGIRKALGATHADILSQFLFESSLLCLIGGVLGIGIGAGAAFIVSMLAKWPALVSFSTIGIAVGFSLAVGLFFGLYPASRAARLDPIEALRYE